MQRIKSVDFAVNGLAGSLGYRLINSGGSITLARTNAGVVAIGSGAYFALINITDNWDGILLWDDGQTPRVYAHEVIDKNSLGSMPSYVGSMVWSKNPNNFITANTFGQRIDKILERASSGVGGVAVSSQVFNDKEKQKLFDWIKAMTDRVTSIEIIIKELDPRLKKEIAQLIVDIKVNQTKLQEALQDQFKIDKKQKENIKDDLNLIANSFSEIAGMNERVEMIKKSLIDLAEKVPSMIQTELPARISSVVALQSQEIKNLISQSINITTDVAEKLKNNLIALEEQRHNLKLTDKVLLTLVPTERLKDIVEHING